MILEQVQQILSTGKHMSIPALVERIPELHGRVEAEEILYLLLRLDKRFERDKDLWFSKAVKVDPTAKIVAAAEDYFKAHNPRGELIEHLLKGVVEATGEDQQQVRTVILKRYESRGRMVLNRLKPPDSEI